MAIHCTLPSGRLRMAYDNTATMGISTCEKTTQVMGDARRLEDDEPEVVLDEVNQRRDGEARVAIPRNASRRSSRIASRHERCALSAFRARRVREHGGGEEQFQDLGLRG